MNHLIGRVQRLSALCFGVEFPRVNLSTSGGGPSAPWYAKLEAVDEANMQTVGASPDAALELLIAKLVTALGSKRAQTVGLLSRIDSALDGERVLARKDGSA